MVTKPVYYKRYPKAFGSSLLPLYSEVNRIIPIVAQHDTNAKKAILFLVSYLCVIERQIMLERISAIAVADDMRKRLLGMVSR